MKRIDIIHAFLNNATPCSTPNRSLSFVGNKLYSYSTCIAKRVDNKVFINPTKYSTTTSCHQNMTARVATQKGFSVQVVDLFVAGKSYFEHD